MMTINQKVKENVSGSINVIKVCVVMVGLALLFQQMIYAEESHINHIEEAELLKEIGLFKGSNKGFELEREATRVEGAVIVVRLLGKESVALEYNYEHPFTDVPDWASAYVGYLYKNSLTNGIGDNLYGSYDLISPDQFMTFCLRGLGYSDKLGDFDWKTSLDKGLELGIVEQPFKAYLQDSQVMYRDDIVAVLMNVLNTEMKIKEMSFIEYLIEEDLISFEEAWDKGLYKQSYSMTDKIVIARIETDLKPVTVYRLNEVNYFIPMSFADDETSYIGWIEGKDGAGRSYRLLIDKSIGLTKESLSELVVGDEFVFTGELAIDLTDEYKSVRNLYLLTD